MRVPLLYRISPSKYISIYCRACGIRGKGGRLSQPIANCWCDWAAIRAVNMYLHSNSITISVFTAHAERPSLAAKKSIKNGPRSQRPLQFILSSGMGQDCKWEAE